MQLQYINKKTEKDILENTKLCKLVGQWECSHNKIIQGDNLPVLKTLLSNYNLKSKVDLVYIDPPFSTKTNFTIESDRANTISRSSKGNIAYSDQLTGYEFLEFLRERLIFIREIMSDKSSIYLHIDYKIGHYVKILMDEIFGAENFRNDISRIKCNPKNFKRKAYGNIKDMILFYSKSKNYTWNEIKEKFTEKDIERLFKKLDKDKRRYTTIPLHAPGETRNGPTGEKWRGIHPPKGRHWRSNPQILEQLDKEGLVEWSSNGVPRKKIFADEKEGKKKQDIWEYKDTQYPSYPTEKNLDLLKRIVMASSNPGDLVLDCFCGSGTTLIASEELGRQWVGIDESEYAIEVTKRKLSTVPGDLFSSDINYRFFETEKIE